MCSRTTKDIVSKFADLPEGERQELIAGALAATASLKWLPLPGPQTQANFSEADILLYGGAGHNFRLILRWLRRLLRQVLAALIRHLTPQSALNPAS